MASLTFQDSDIRKVNPKNIPPIFLMWYRKQSEMRKAEIRRLNPRLVAAIAGEILPEDESPVIIHTNNSAGFSLNSVNNSQEAKEKTIEEANPVLDLWESVSLRSWRERNVEVPALVCKIMPTGNRVCHFHSPRVALEERFLKIRTPKGAVYGAHGYYCPECLDFYMEQEEFDETIPGIAEAGIAGQVQPLGVTLDEWRRNGVPNDWDADVPVYYITSAWNEREMSCPVHPETILHPDDYRIRYKDRAILFQACYCAQCGKLIMGRARAGQLEQDCGDKGVPCPELYPLRKRTTKTLIAPRKITSRPDEIVMDGCRKSYASAETWDTLDEKDMIVISDIAFCPDWDHEDQCEETWRVVRLMEKRGGRKSVLIPLCYCKECERFYGAQENLKALLATGRPEVNLLDETDSNSWITSGEIFQSEKSHLQKLEDKLDAEIGKIHRNSGYTGMYEVSRYGYDDGNLAYGKHRSRGDYKQLSELNRWRSKPYGYRVDLTQGTRTKQFYLGNAEISISGGLHVMSYYTSPGREMVNIRTEKVKLSDGKEYRLKLLRRFDIENAQLFGYADEWDDASAFSSEIRDKFLIQVLNTRRKQHQLLDIISTIQKEQNEIIDLPLEQNLIVQGCAGSGKTMVMLHRLSALQAVNPSFRPETTLILTPSQHFNLHIDGLAESLQIQNIRRLSVERYYAATLETYDSSFRLKGKIADEMENDQKWVDTLYSDRFFRVLIEETDAAMDESLKYLETVIPLSIASSSIRTVKGAQLLPILRDAVNENARDVELKENSYLQLKREVQRLEKRVAELDVTISKMEANTGLTAVEQASKAKKRLADEITRKKDNMQNLLSVIEADEEEVLRLEKALFTLNRENEINILREKISEEKEERRDCQEILENLMSIPDFMSASLEELPSQIDRASVYLPELRVYSQIIAQQLTQESEKRQEREDIRVQLEKVRLELNRAETLRYTEETRQEIENLKKQFIEMTLKSLYERTITLAAKREGIRVPGRNKTHRYDLYLQLRYALHYFGKPKEIYNLICIDEGQDLAQNEYRLISDLNGNRTAFNIYGDTRQLLKSGRGIDDWNKVSMLDPALKVYSLNENYRNTNQITEHCNKAFHMQMVKTGMDGTQVKEMYRGDLEKALSSLKAEGERVAIIVPRSVKKETYLHMDNLSAEVRNIISEDAAPGKIALVYVDEVKGIEFDRVFVIPNSMSENEKYIAFTRALSHLSLVFDYSLDRFESNADFDSAEIVTNKKSDALSSKKKDSADKKRTASLNNNMNNITYGVVRSRPKILNSGKGK